MDLLPPRPTEFTPEGLMAWLEVRRIPAVLLDSDDDTSTVESAAAAMGVDPGQIIKTLLFRDRNGMFLKVITAGLNKIRLNRLAEVSELTDLKLASADDVLAITGWPIGSVPPVGVRTDVRTFMDAKVTRFKTVLGGAGAERLMLEIRPVDIVRLTGATMDDLTD